MRRTEQHQAVIRQSSLCHPEAVGVVRSQHEQTLTRYPSNRLIDQCAAVQRVASINTVRKTSLNKIQATHRLPPTHQTACCERHGRRKHLELHSTTECDRPKNGSNENNNKHTCEREASSLCGEKEKIIQRNIYFELELERSGSSHQ